MAIEFKLPAVAEGIESVDIAEILVAEGDKIEAGAVICEVETDKAVAEIESELVQRNHHEDFWSQPGQTQSRSVLHWF